MSWFNDLLFGKDRGPTQTNRDYTQSMQRAGTAANAAQDKYMADNASFDPSASFQSYAKGAFGDFQKNLGTTLRNLTGKSVGAGRFDSGFFDEDQGQVVRDMSNDFTNNLNQRALDTAGMRLSQIGQEGNYALNQSGMYNDLLSGQLDREQAADNAKRQSRGGFWSGILGAAGTALGGPIGGAIASRITRR